MSRSRWVRALVSADRAAEPPMVWISGVGWDDMPGTDKRMVLALAERFPVI